jgi:hypothetical protein
MFDTIDWIYFKDLSLVPPFLGVFRESRAFTQYMGVSFGKHPNMWGSTFGALSKYFLLVTRGFVLRLRNLKVLCFFRDP